MIFPQTPILFKILGAFDAKNLEFYVPQNPIFGVRVNPLGQGPPNSSMKMILTFIPWKLICFLQNFGILPCLTFT